MNSDTILYSGKAKDLYPGPTDTTIIQHFKDSATAFNGEKKAELPGKGILNCSISSFLMGKIEGWGLPTHYIKRLSEREQLVYKLDMYPVEVVVRNIAAGSIVKRLGVGEGLRFNTPILEFYYKDDALSDPFINEDHIREFGWVDADTLILIKGRTTVINSILRSLFYAVDIDLVDFKLEFGESEFGLMLGDEISPDGCRLWDRNTGEKFDKDRFRLGIGGEVAAYQEVARRLGGTSEIGLIFPSISVG